MAKKDDTTALTQLGNKETEYKFVSPNPGMLEHFPNQFPERDYLINHETSEFTSLCPKTGQPDFANIRIEYVPDKLCVETKSLKLYLFAYRGEGTFMETIVNKICSDLVAVLDPRSLRVIGSFGARGGIMTTVDVAHAAAAT